MGQFLSQCTSHFFADDVAAVLTGQLGVRYTNQCIDLEKRIKSFLDSLEYYSCLADQPLNRTKTEAMFSARAIGPPNFNITFDSGDDKYEKPHSTYERSPTTGAYQHNQLHKNNHVVAFSNNKEVVGGGIIVEDYDDVGKENLFTDNNDNESVLLNDDQHIEDYGNYDGNDEDYNDNKNDDDYDDDANIDNDHTDDKNDDDNNNDNDRADDKKDDEDDDAVDADDSDDNEDNWRVGAEVDPNDPTLTKEQQLTLSVLIKCRKLIDMIRKSSILTLYINIVKN
ncbi:unnamed protein product [Rotaria sp. Silwood1]|nr:unnamed protein product [Rotaria sp. Silwood1]CAF1655180.1 unnamed protein product [Rotaria sp. Silwood1]